MASNRNTDGWMPPRGGGYQPGKNTTANVTPPRPKTVKPPKGGAGVGKAHSG